ncbi:MAG: HalX domain-containing protein [Halobacteriaceae archaeon]
MPDLSGDKVLDEIRTQGLDFPVAMVTAVEPDFDVLELGFDDYVVKPVDREELSTLVERLLELTEVRPDVQEYFSMRSKKDALESQKSQAELSDNSEYRELTNDIEIFGKKIISLAEQVIENSNRSLQSEDRTRIKDEILKWEQRAESVDEGDPLYQEAQERIQDLQVRLDREPNEAKRQLLEAVAEGFIAEGFWLDPKIQRALNLIFYDKYDDSLVVNRRPIETAAEAGGGAKFDASQQVRQLASQKLA